MIFGVTVQRCSWWAGRSPRCRIKFRFLVALGTEISRQISKTCLPGLVTRPSISETHVTVSVNEYYWSFGYAIFGAGFATESCTSDIRAIETPSRIIYINVGLLLAARKSVKSLVKPQVRSSALGGVCWIWGGVWCQREANAARAMMERMEITFLAIIICIKLRDLS